MRMRWSALVVCVAMALAACTGETGTSETSSGDDDGPAAVPDTTVADASTGTTGGGGACAVDQTDGGLNLFNWSDYIDPELITSFEEEYGVDVIETFYDSNEDMLAQIQSGVVYDLVVPSDYMVKLMIQEDLLLPLVPAAIPNLSNLGDQFRGLPYDPEGEYSVPYQWGTIGLGVNLSVVGEDFTPSWALALNPAATAEYPGGVSLLNDPRETMGAALKFLNFSLNETSEDALGAATKIISDANVTVFDSDQYADNLVNGEVAVAHGYSGDFFAALAAAENPENYAYVVPQEGGALWTHNMAIPAVAEHPCTAHTFINFIMDAENGAQLTNWTFYASPNEAANEFILPEVLEDPAIYPDEEVFAQLEPIRDTGEAEILFTDYFNVAKSG